MTSADGADRNRVLVLLPTTKDSERTVTLLAEASISSVACSDLAELCRELRAGADAILVSDEVIFSDTTGILAEVMRQQPPWSAIPVLVLAREGSIQHVQKAASDELTSVTIVERPVRMHTLVSVVLAALRTRHHQYQIRDALRVSEQQAAKLRAQQEALEASRIELARHAAQLVNADRRKDEFLATLAHELRNPLAPIRTGLQLLSGAPPPDTTRHTIEVMQRQTAHMVRLIDDLLDVSRITRGKLELRRERVTLGSILDAALEGSRPLIDRNGHALRVSVAEPSLMLDADLTRLAQVVSNLLNNASKYTAPGGLIELGALRDGADVLIEVRDNGVGIPADRISDVFEMFSQVNRTFEHTHGGLGIGLALVRSLVEMHGGRVTAASEGAGAGSTFTVRLPLALDATEQSPPKATAIAAEARAEQRILVVDDNDDAADLLALMLEQAGYATEVVHDGPAALARVEDWTPDVAILDIGLPGMSGYEVARALRADRRFAGIALIALTGWGSERDKQRALDAGFDSHLTKPVDAGELHGTLAAFARRDVRRLFA